MKIVVETQEEAQRPRCVYCRADAEASEELTRCPGCAATFHAPCLIELDRCTTLGCGGLDAQIEAAQAVARARPRPASTRRGPPELVRPRGVSAVSRYLAIGCLVGLALGFASTGLASGGSLQPGPYLLWAPGMAVWGMLVAGLVALLGIRREPLMRMTYTTYPRDVPTHHDDNRPVVYTVVGGAALFFAKLTGDVAGVSGVVPGLALGAGLALPLVLHLIGHGGAPRSPPSGA